MKLLTTSSTRIGVALLLALLSSGCSFNRAWNAAATTPVPASDIQGRWQGTWVSEANAHTGRLRCLVTKLEDGKYQARYHAKYRKILGFGYTAVIEATQTDGNFKFTGEADLGWAGGVYHYEGKANATNFYSTYQSKYDHGIFQMSRAGMRKGSNVKVALSIAAFIGRVVFAAAAGEPPPVKSVETLAGLQQRLSDHLSEPRFAAASWGVKVVSLDTGRILFAHNAEKLFSPASNSKLYTTALALDRLGADYRIKTSLYATVRPNRRGILSGDLIVYGRGDPTINARLNGGEIYQALEPLVAALIKAGVKRIEGDLVGDDSYFRGPPFGSGWVWDDTQSYYGAEISALTINDNFLQLAIKPGARAGAPCQLTLSPATTFVILSNRTLTVAQGLKRSIALYRPPGGNVTYVSGQLPMDDTDYTDHVTIHNPAELFVTFFKDALARHGIKVNGRTRTVNWLDRQVSPLEVAKYVELAAVESLPVRDLVREIQKPSQNLYADLLLAHVGANSLTTNAPQPQTSEESGIAALETFLSQAGIGKGDVQFEEGSGLSRNNLTTPNATIALLQFMSRHKWAEIYRDALPIAGVDGTLSNRMKDTLAAGNVRAKTGTLRWANALSGYATSAAGERLVFSIMLNRYHNTDPGHSAREDIDALAVMLASFNGHTDRPNEK